MGQTIRNHSVAFNERMKEQKNGKKEVKACCGEGCEMHNENMQAMLESDRVTLRLSFFSVVISLSVLVFLFGVIL